MASLLYNGDGGEKREAVGVSDPETADAFFVPFFSSLSFNTHGHNMTDPETEVDRLLQVQKMLIGHFKLFNFYQPWFNALFCGCLVSLEALWNDKRLDFLELINEMLLSNMYTLYIL